MTYIDYRKKIETGGITIFYIACTVIVFGNILDIIHISNTKNLVINSTNAAFSIASAILYAMRKISLKNGFFIAILILFANFLLSRYYHIRLENLDLIMLRESLFVCAIIGISVIYIYRWFAYIITTLYIIHLCIISYYYNIAFLKENLILISIVLMFFSWSTSYFYKLIYRVLKELDEKRNSLQSMNNELSASKSELEQINATKDKMFKVISHDLRGPSSTVAGFAELLFKPKNITPEKEEKFKQALYFTSRSLVDLTENLLYWAKNQSKKETPVPELFVIEHLVKGTLELLSTTLENKQISISLETTGESEVFADKNMLLIVVRNLISNAVKFTHNGGSIKISLKQNENSVRFEVTDTGIGMDQETSSKLFTQETIESQRGTNDEKGTGLGLSLCKEYIDMHEGEIGVESVLGKGSVFWFSLPKR